MSNPPSQPTAALRFPVTAPGWRNTEAALWRACIRSAAHPGLPTAGNPPYGSTYGQQPTQGVAPRRIQAGQAGHGPGQAEATAVPPAPIPKGRHIQVPTAWGAGQPPSKGQTGLGIIAAV